MSAERSCVKPRQNYHLYLEDISKVYGGKRVLGDIDLAVSTGERVTIVGPSGCGKSTLLRLILGQELPTSGGILLKGEAVGKPSPDRGIVYQKYGLLQNLTVIENVRLGLRLSKTPWQAFKDRHTDRELAMDYIDKVGLAKDPNKYPHELSGGMQQRVAIAQALIMNPKVLCMDEPYSALDPGTREDMQVLLLDLWAKFNMTIFFVTHDLEEAVFLGSRIIALSQYYTDGRGNGKHVKRGARIVCDYTLDKEPLPAMVKSTAKFGEVIQHIRHKAMSEDCHQHVTDFDLQHPDSFLTLTDEVRAPTPVEPKRKDMRQTS